MLWARATALGDGGARSPHRLGFEAPRGPRPLVTVGLVSLSRSGGKGCAVSLGVPAVTLSPLLVAQTLPQEVPLPRESQLWEGGLPHRLR